MSYLRASRHGIGGEFATSSGKSNRPLASFFVGLALQALRVAAANIRRAEVDTPLITRDALEHVERAMKPLEDAYPGLPDRRGLAAKTLCERIDRSET